MTSYDEHVECTFSSKIIRSRCVNMGDSDFDSFWRATEKKKSLRHEVCAARWRSRFQDTVAATSTMTAIINPYKALCNK